MEIKLYGLKNKDGIEYELILEGYGTNWIQVRPVEKPRFDFSAFKYHCMCARATLYPGKSIEEVEQIVDKLKDK